MEQLEILGFADLLSTIHLSNIVLYPDNIAIIHVDESNLKEPKKEEKHLLIRLNAIVLVLVKRGEFKINIDYVLHTISENKFIVLNQRNILQMGSVSHDFKGTFVIAETGFIRNVIGEQEPPINHMLANPIIQLTQDEYMVLKNSIDRIQSNILRNEHPYQAKLINNEFANLVFEIWNFNILHSGQSTTPQRFGHREHIVTEFFKLLFLHRKEQREVAFYANKLCITPVYLSRAVKHTIGIPAIKIITDMILSDAKLLLRNPKTTIQEISENLNFPDQATFSKFFKKHTGETPSKYKQKNQ